MQYEEIIKNYIQKIVTKDMTEEDSYYPYQIEDSIRIYATKQSQIKRDVSFIIHSHEAQFSAVKFMYNDELSVHVNSYGIIIFGTDQKFTVSTSDDYFNISLSNNLTLPFSLLKSIQQDMVLNYPKRTITFFMDEFNEYFN